MNPFLGLLGAIPLGIGVLKLEPLGVGALAGPASFFQIVLFHGFWEWLRRRPRIALWLDRQRSERVSRLLDRRGIFIAALIATTLIGGLPCYVTLRYLGFGFGRFWTAMLLAQVLFGWAAVGIWAAST